MAVHAHNSILQKTEAGGSVRAQGQLEEYRKSLRLGVGYVPVIPALVRLKEIRVQEPPELCEREKGVGRRWMEKQISNSAPLEHEF